MSKQAGCLPSSLINSIYYGLPYFTGAPAVNISVDDLVNNLARASGWAGILFVIVVVISICTCCYCCCVSVVCSMRQREKPLALKAVLGLVTGGIIVVAIIIMCVLFWAETALHNDITGEVINVVTDIINLDVNNSNPIPYGAVNTIIGIDQSRHLAFIIYLVLLLFFLLAVLAVVALAPVCKSGIGVIIAVIATGFFTITNGLLLAGIFGVIVGYTQYCVVIFSINIPDICDEAGNLLLVTQNIHIWLDFLNVFCNQSVEHGFTIFMLAVVLVILFILIQIFGFAYGISFFGMKRESVAVNIQTEESSGAQLTGFEESCTSKDNVPLTDVVKYP